MKPLNRRVELIAETAVVRHSPRAEFREMDEGAVLTQIDTEQYHGLNPVGALIWSLIDGRSFGTLVAEVRAHLTEPPVELADDVSEFIQALAKRKLVDISDPESA